MGFQDNQDSQERKEQVAFFSKIENRLENNLPRLKNQNYYLVAVNIRSKVELILHWKLASWIKLKIYRTVWTLETKKQDK